MPDFDNDTAWTARNAANIPPEDSFFSDNAQQRWQNANLPSDTVLEANKLNMSMATDFSLLYHLRRRFTMSAPAVCAAVSTYSTGLTSFWIDVCLSMAYNIGFWVVANYRSNATRSFGSETSRRIHLSGHQNIAHNSWIWSYLVIKFTITVSFWLTGVVIDMILQPRDYMSTKTVIAITALAITVSIVWQAPQQCLTWADWLLTRFVTVFGLAFLLIVAAYNKLSIWASQFHDAGMERVQQSWPLKDFEYTTLPPGKIRLLALDRKLPFRGIQARLLIVSLDEAPTYEAISYTWGNCTERRSILLEGKRFTTTRTAWDALNAHSSRWRPTTVWIDQICINQADDVEKGQQVAMMFDIYRGADRVVAHLGTSPTAPAAVAMLSELMWQEFQDSDVEIAGFLQTALAFQNYPAIATMLQHPWFSRVWVVQEVAAAKELAIAYGGYMVDWESMASAIRVLMRPGIRDPLIAHPMACDPQHLEKIMRQIANVLEMMVIGRRARENLAGGFMMEVLRLTPAYSLPWMLARTTNFMATDPRDKIYAVQSVSLPSRLPYLDPLRFDYDYTKSVERLYIQLAVDVMFEFPDPFYLMSYSGLDKRGDLELPSWVPDWTTSYKWHYGFNSRLDVQDLALVDVVGDLIGAGKNPTMPPKNGAYRAGGSSRPVKMFKDLSLAVHGVTIGAITNVSQVTAPDLAKDAEQYVNRHGQSMFPKKVKKLSAWLREAKAMAEEVYTDDPSACDDAFWRTLIGDRWEESRPASEEAECAYMAWKYAQACWDMVCVALDLGVPDVELPRHDLFYKARTYEPVWLTAFSSCAAYRSFATITGKYVAIVPQSTKIGDLVVVPLGARTPWVLRPLDSGRFQFVGEAYAHGLMDGECITPAIALGAKVLSIYFAREGKKRRDEERGSERTEPEWVEVLANKDLIWGYREDIGDTSDVPNEDVIRYGEDGMANVPGCEWFLLE